MLAGLFEEGGVISAAQDVVGTKCSIPSPPRPRLNCGLAGISNQGATCYLNSLLQTLFLTPEFRESLFDLDENDLGSLDNRETTAKKVRVIPIQVQRLFARLLLSDQQNVPTVDLTESFGWTNNEELQQHDVQELNRILFSALEDSLIGTVGRDLIRHLYHGTIVNQIICQECGTISEREEDFLDLTVTVAGNPGLENGLFNNYCEMESMEGSNQYRCETCNRLVNAKKGAKIRALPEILTLSILRFSFDFQKLQRYKETGKFVFPMELDMAPFYEKESDPQVYELFSVVIHRGGAYGGHYHAYIRDVDGLGKWTHPEEEKVQITADSSKGEVDFIDCDNPLDLIKTILERAPDKKLSVDKLCGEITKQTGVSWNKRFKRQYGSIHRFLAKNDDLFTMDQSSHSVTLKEVDISEIKIQDSNEEEVETDEKDKNNCSSKRPLSPPPPVGSCWFDFDDSRVHPIKEKEIQKTFSGKSSAYMLFYRKKSLIRPREAQGMPAYRVPDSFISEVMAENDFLVRQREDFEIEVNKITLQIHFTDGYELRQGALHPLPDRCSYVEITLDRRKKVTDLRTEILKVGGDSVEDTFRIHTMKELPAGFHLYEEVLDAEDKQLMNIPLGSGDMLFIWDGDKVGSDFVPVGVSCEPVYLSIIYGNTGAMSWGYAKNLTLNEFKVMISMSVNIPLENIKVKRLVEKGDESKVVDFSVFDFGKSLSELKLTDCDKLLVEDKMSESGVPGNVLVSSKVVLYIELRVSQSTVSDGNKKNVRLEVDKTDTVAEVKMTALSLLNVADIDCGGRLRIDHDTLGLRPPLHEQLTLAEAALTNKTCLVLEPGQAPETNQITLTFTPGNPGGDLPDIEVIVDRSITVGECLTCMLNRAGFTDDSWHLRKTNWCGESADVLDDPDLALEQALVNDGDHILLVEGRLPPKGHIRLDVLLYPSLDKPPAHQTGMDSVSWISDSITNLLQINNTGGTTLLEPLILGDVEMSLEEMLEDLQLMILTMPLLSGIDLPTPDFVRIRTIEENRISTILRGKNQPLKKLKLKSCSKIAVQILPHEENLTVNQIVLQIQERLPDTRLYGPRQEVIWDISQGATVKGLRQTIADACMIPPEFLHIAKYFHKRFEWMIVKEQQNQQQKNHGGGRGKKKGPKSNLKQSPYYFHDGDIVGVKNLQFHQMNRDDFGTIEDDLGKEELDKIAEEKKKERELKKKRQEEFGGFDMKPRRPEVALTIKVEDFR